MYSNAAHTIGFCVVFAGWTVSELAGPVRWSKVRRGEKRDRGSIVLAIAVGLTGVVLALCFPLVFPAIALPPTTFFVGIALVVIGAGWRWYAIKTLGRYFTATVMIQEEQPIVEDGPYRFIRHPSYTGVLIVVAGLGCMIGNGLSLLAILIGLLVPLLYRIRIEEKALREHNEHYQRYMEKTKWRLVPFLF